MRRFEFVLNMFLDEMSRNRLSEIILDAPAWVRLGLAVTDARLRERAADALAAMIVEKSGATSEADDPNQLALSI